MCCCPRTGDKHHLLLSKLALYLLLGFPGFLTFVVWRPLFTPFPPKQATQRPKLLKKGGSGESSPHQLLLPILGEKVLCSGVGANLKQNLQAEASCALLSLSGSRSSGIVWTGLWSLWRGPVPGESIYGGMKSDLAPWASACTCSHVSGSREAEPVCARVLVRDSTAGLRFKRVFCCIEAHQQTPVWSLSCNFTSLNKGK